MPQPSCYFIGQIIHQHYKRPRSPTELPVAEQKAILLQLSKEKYIYLPKGLFIWEEVIPVSEKTFRLAK